MRRLTDHATAEDVVQATFCRVLEYRLAGSRPITAAYLRVVARSVLMKERLRAARQSEATDGLRRRPIEVPRADASESARRVQDSVAGLRREHRDALLLTTVYGLSVHEASLCLDVPDTTLRNGRMRAIRRVRSALHVDEPPQPRRSPSSGRDAERTDRVADPVVLASGDALWRMRRFDPPPRATSAVRRG